MQAARTSVDRLLGHRVLRRRSAQVSAESALRGARASAALEGADRPLDVVRGWSQPAYDGQGHLVSGALRVSAEIGALVPVWRRAPLQALARLHVLAAADAVPPDELGRPQVDAAAGARLAALAELAAGPPGAPAVVEAAVVHGELLVLRPFGWGGGLVARAAARLVLVSRGLDPTSLAAPEVGHAEREADYRSAAGGYAAGTVAGVTAWVVHCAGALESGAYEGLAICEALLRAG